MTIRDQFRLLLTVIVCLIAFSFGATRADEQTPPSAPYALVDEEITFHGTPGDPDFYEVHRRKGENFTYFVDANGKIYPTLAKLLSANQSTPVATK